MAATAAATLASIAIVTASFAVEEQVNTNGGLETTEPPAFPEPRRAPLRLWLGSSFAPSANIGAADVDLARPEASLRARLPVDDRVSVQLTGAFSASFYDIDGGSVFTNCRSCPLPDKLYSASLSTEGGYMLNRTRYLFRADERWALLGSLSVSANWEPGAFEDSVRPGFSLGGGYELPSKLRLALGVQVERALDGDGVDVGPTVYVRWDVTPRVRLRNRGLGATLEVRPSPRLEATVSAWQSGNRFRLDDRPGVSGGATFRDRQIVVGAGLAFRLTKALRITAETGAIMDRNLAVETRNDGQLEGVDGGVSPYLTLRMELRP